MGFANPKDIDGNLYLHSCPFYSPLYKSIVSRRIRVKRSHKLDSFTQIRHLPILRETLLLGRTDPKKTGSARVRESYFNNENQSPNNQHLPGTSRDDQRAIDQRDADRRRHRYDFAFPNARSQG